MASAASIAHPLNSAAATAPRPAFTAEQIKELKHSRASAGKFRRAVSYARFDAWCVAIFAGLTIPFNLTDPAGLMLGVGMAVVAAVEFRAAAALRRAEPRAARVLGFNQLALAALLIAYAGYQLYTTAYGPSPIAEAMDQGPEVAALMQPYEGLARSINYGVYGSLIVIACLMQGGTALYYFTRGKYVAKYAKETPAWIAQLQREGMLA